MSQRFPAKILEKRIATARDVDPMSVDGKQWFRKARTWLGYIFVADFALLSI